MPPMSGGYEHTYVHVCIPDLRCSQLLVATPLRYIVKSNMLLLFLLLLPFCYACNLQLASCF